MTQFWLALMLTFLSRGGGEENKQFIKYLKFSKIFSGIFLCLVFLPFSINYVKNR